VDNTRLSENVFDKARRSTAMYLTAKVPASDKRIYFGLIVWFLTLCLFFPITSRAAGIPLKTLKTETGQEPQIPKGLSPDEVDAYLAGLSDVQARQVLARKLKQDAAENLGTKVADDATSEDRTPDNLFYELADGAATVLYRIGALFSGDKSASLRRGAILSRLSDGKGIGQLLLTVFFGFAIIACGLLVERLFLRLTDGLRKQILNTVALGKLQQLGRFFSRLLLDALGIGVYILTTFILFIIIFRQEEAGYWIVADFLIVSYYFLVIRFAAKMIMSPASAPLRPLPLQDRDAKFLYRWIVRISLVAAILVTPARILLEIGRSEALFNLFYMTSGLSVIVLMIVMIWQSRQRVAEAICAESTDGTCIDTSLKAKFARSWHYFAFLYVAGSGSFWLINVFLSGQGKILNLIGSLFLIPIFIGIDQWVQRLLKMASGELTEVIDLSGEAETEDAEEPPEDKKSDIKHFAPFIRKAFRVLMVIFLFFIILKLWGIDLSFVRIFTRGALSIVVALLLGFVLWEFIKARIDRKLKEEMPDSDEDMEEGGAGGSRTGTLLMLLRKFVLVVMLVMVSLIILSSIGVNIGPLIAGAGVIGLAIGFGAQTLVKDIISGIFFLIDDAFRVGDFIEVGGTKGSVEHISLRSLRLRNPRGPVHTIPFGSMGTVTNNSRDYIITKLDFRVRYDTDVDKVRKIIKKINIEIENDEEMGPVMLDKIKSQGVRELDDSAMIMRVKFKTIPGEQFVVRREVFRMMKEAFAANGIEFAHRNVTVYLPQDENQAASAEGPGEDKDSAAATTAPDKKLLEAAAGAAAVAIQAEEDKKAEEARKSKQ
jgi:moderate conductance mechanosensitive channel